MYTRVNCPNCRTPFQAELHQVIDASVNPELKQRLLAGQLNVAVCPNCGAGGQMATALLFHDPDHEMFVVHVPQELSLNQMDREKLIGQLTRQAMNDLPSEKRRAYMLQPQMMLSMQQFLEKVLETEGITSEMIARQRGQAELLQTLAMADKDVADHLLQERATEIDGTFFAMLQAHIDAVAQSDNGAQLVALTNLRAKLMVNTPFGRQLEKQQVAVHALGRDAKKKNGLTPEILLKHILSNQEEDGVVDALVAAGRGALTYTFFSRLTAEIDKVEAAGNAKAAGRLTRMRERLLEQYDALQKESQRVLAEADETLNALLAAADRQAAIRKHVAKIDETFMYLLSRRIAEAEASGDHESVRTLGDLHEAILLEAESQFPPELLLLNQLLEAGSSEEQRRILEDNHELITPDLIGVLDAVSKELDSSSRGELNGRLKGIRAMIEARL